jgi:hypothetical protein
MRGKARTINDFLIIGMLQSAGMKLFVVKRKMGELSETRPSTNATKVSARMD